ncbi:MAG: HAD-IIA family hydrolase [Chitinophagaceae bacterium]
MCIIKVKKLFLFDLDGTIYTENVLIDGALECLKAVVNKGGKYVFLTNNSSKNLNYYVNKLTGLGIEVNESNFYTSTLLTIDYLNDNFLNKKVYPVGTNLFVDELVEAGINVTFNTNDAECLVVAFDTELNYKKLNDASFLLSKKLPFVATNPDLSCPVNFGFIPDCGSICNMLYTVTGQQAHFIGKPNRKMVDTVIAKNKFSQDETIVIGDRLYTDVACGINAEVTTAIVLTGETKFNDLEKSPYKPNFVLQSVKDLIALI